MPLRDDVKALIFDCDGVLVDSEILIHEVEMECLTRMGLHYEKAEFVRHFSGLTEARFLEEVSLQLRAAQNRELPPWFIKELRTSKRTAVDTRLQALPGVQEFVAAWLKPKAVASSSLRHSLVRKLSMFDLLNAFEPHIYSAESVVNGKPHPDIFVLAANKLGVDAHSCLVIEDSIHGIEAARVARIPAIGFVGGSHCLSNQGQLLKRAGATRVVSNFAELKELLM